MKSEDWLAKATATLKKAGIGTARLDSLILLEDVLGMERSYVLAMPKRILNNHQLAVLDAQLKRRQTHEPLAYIRGKIAFYRREFKIDPRVLQPRPETETMIEMFLSLPVAAKSTVADIGTGSGCIAVTIKLEKPTLDVLATDIDPACLQIARLNARRLQAKITFKKGDLLQPLLRHQTPLKAVLANLPYVPNNFRLNEAALNEPRLAMYGGGDGLNLYRQFFTQIHKFAVGPPFVLTESLPPQHRSLAAIAKPAGYRLAQTEDFIQLFTAET